VVLEANCNWPITSDYCFPNRNRFDSCPWRQKCLRQQTEDLARWHRLTVSHCQPTPADGDAVPEVRSSSTTPYRTMAVPRLTSLMTKAYNCQRLCVEQGS